MTTRVLVTGGAGFIGSHLVDHLVANGEKVTALDDLSTGRYPNIRHLLDNPNFRFVEASVLDMGKLEREVASADAVYHLAAAVGVQLIVDRPLQSLLTNIKGTENVLEAAERHRVKIMVASTSEIYGKSANGPFKEDDDRLLGSPRKLRWSYSTSKAVDEILAFVYYKELRLPTVVVRLFNTIGPRQVGQYGMVVPRFITQALRGEDLTVYGDGKQSRSFTFVGDVVKAMARLMSTPEAEGEVFNVAGHEEITIRDLAQLVIDRTASSSKVKFVPFEEVYGEGFEEMTRRAADTAKLEQTIGYRCDTSLADALDLMIEFARDSVPR
ncbi:MAG TPA: GDP-mannose 4,6-dehydratase [Candidatus Dormibacteraeota bacterium]|nr:GDP-mannose 4,6-dehydratase [Candidatus Dormibacteraeota bacterium]